MYYEGKLWLGKSEDKNVVMYPKMANRHGLIAGATGTGKTVTLKVLAESFSDCGVPVFLADVKGDLAATCQTGSMTENIEKRLADMGVTDYSFSAYPVNFWDTYGEMGLPLRTTITEMGPLLLSRIMNLTEVQSSVLNLVFKIADDEGLLLIDTKDLKAMLQYVAENVKDYAMNYGNMSKQTLGVIQRNLVALEAEGADVFFGEPALNIKEWLGCDCDGKGMIQILDCQKFIQHPTMYAVFLLWLISELYETLPELGDVQKPRLVFFFDEAHLLFDDAPKVLLDKIAQVVKLIRSKGVGIYFVTQNPQDLPDEVLAQLGNKIQHALRAYTPAEQKKVKAAALSYRANPAFDTYETLMNLATGEALISVLDEEGIPTMVEKTKILPPKSQMGSIDDSLRQSMIDASSLIKYKDYVDNDSAYEFLHRRDLELEEQAKEAEEEKARAKEEAIAAKQKEKEEAAAAKAKEKEEAAAAKAKEKEEAAARKEEEKKKKQAKSAVGKVASTAAGTVGREIGNSVGKSVGGTFGKKLGGNVGASLGRGLLNTLFKL